MKKLALVIATLALAFTATGCQNWTGGKSNCCKSNCCNKQQRCGKRNCNKNCCKSSKNCRCGTRSH